VSYMRGRVYAARQDKEIVIATEDESITLKLHEFDSLVVMRYSQIEAEGRLNQVEEATARAYGGNLGCQELRRKLNLPTIDEIIKQYLGEEDKKKGREE